MNTKKVLAENYNPENDLSVRPSLGFDSKSSLFIQRKFSNESNVLRSRNNYQSRQSNRHNQTNQISNAKLSKSTTRQKSKANAHNRNQKNFHTQLGTKTMMKKYKDERKSNSNYKRKCDCLKLSKNGVVKTLELVMEHISPCKSFPKQIDRKKLV